jgi:hypothetical protein
VVAVRLAVDPHRDDAPVELLDASLTYHDPLTGQTGTHESIYLAAYATSDEEQIEDSRDPAIEAEVARQRAAATTLHAVLATQRGDLVEADRLLREAAPKAAAAAKEYRDNALENQAEQMESLANELDSPDRGRLMNKVHGDAMINFQARAK